MDSQFDINFDFDQSFEAGPSVRPEQQEGYVNNFFAPAPPAVPEPAEEYHPFAGFRPGPDSQDITVDATEDTTQQNTHNVTANVETGRQSTTYITEAGGIAELDIQTGKPHGYRHGAGPQVPGPIPCFPSPNSDGRFACPHEGCIYHEKGLASNRTWVEHQKTVHNLRKSFVVVLRLKPAQLANFVVEKQEGEEGTEGAEIWKRLQGLV